MNVSIILYKFSQSLNCLTCLTHCKGRTVLFLTEGVDCEVYGPWPDERRPDENSDRKGINGVDKQGEINSPIPVDDDDGRANQAPHRIMIVMVSRCRQRARA